MEARIPASLRQLNTEMAAVVERVSRSLVCVTHGHGAGAGIIVRPDGLVVTNAHVVRRGTCRVCLPDGRTLPGRLLTQDARRDLALLAVEATDLLPIEMGSSKELRPGQRVLALGHPWGIAGAVTAGTVASMGAQAEWPGRGREWVAVSVRLRPGHSGGPLVDVRGRLVGMNTIMAGPDVGLAVPAHVIEDFIWQSRGTPAAAV